MPAYLTISDLQGKIPEAFLIEALDDDKDGVIDAFEQVEQDVRDYIEGILSTAYAVPFATVPKMVLAAAKPLCCEAVYKRRGVAPEANPWTSEADAMRKLLERIARRDIMLQATEPEALPVNRPATAIVQTSALGTGRLM